jgi:predicted nucleic acid-binding protein
VSGWLLDVNVLLGCGWKSHAEHAALLRWLQKVEEWAACPVTELGFVRIGMTTAYQASFDDARKSLVTLRGLSDRKSVV